MRDRGEVMGGVIRAFSTAARLLLRAPAFTIAAVASLALGVAINTAAFGFLDATVLSPPPYSASDELYVFHDPRRTTRLMDESEATALATSFSPVRTSGAYRAGVAGRYTLGVEVGGARYEGLGMATSAFQTLRTTPMRGRLFANDEELAGTPVVVVGYELWRRAFEADTAAIGRSLRIGGVQHVVIGVMPRGFAFPFDNTSFWVPLRDRVVVAPTRSLSVVGRVTPGLTRQQLFAALRTYRHPVVDARDDADLDAASLAESRRYTDEGALYAMQIAVALVFLIACVNISNLVLSRAQARRRELAVRSALGASARALAADALAETVVLAAVSATLGTLGASALLGALSAVLPPGPVQQAVDVGLSWRAIAYSVTSTVIALGVMSVAPMLHAARADIRPLLGSRGGTGRGGTGTTRWRGGFVVAQLALSLLLLTDTMVMVWVLRRAQRWDTGIDARGAMRADLTRSDGSALTETVLDRLRASGASSAGAAATLPLPSGVVSSLGADRDFVCQCSRVTKQYLDALGVRAVDGRVFGSTDVAGSGVVVDSVLAAQLWPGERAVGKPMVLGASGSGAGVATVVGVVRPIQLAPPAARRAGRRAPGAAYVLASLDTTRTMTIVARGLGASPARALRGSLEGLGALDLQRALGLEEFLEAAMRPFQWYATVFGALAGLATALAVVGLYGVVSYTTTQRVREIGIRLALGATPGSVRRLVLGVTTRLVIVGVIAGAGGALVTVGVLRGAVPGVTAGVAAFAAVAGSVLLAAVALLASAAPAIGASRLQPAELLRGA